MTANNTRRRHRAATMAGPLAIVIRWEYGGQLTSAPTRRLLIACRACGHPQVGTRDAAVLRAWAHHVRTTHPEYLPTVPFAASAADSPGSDAPGNDDARRPQ